MVANELEIMDGKFTGNVIGDIVDAQYKAKTLTRLAQEYEIPLASTVAIWATASQSFRRLLKRQGWICLPCQAKSE